MEENKMVESRCGLLCSECSFREETDCKSCANMDPFEPIAVPLRLAVNPRSITIAVNVMILSAPCSIPLLMIWNRATTA